MRRVTTGISLKLGSTAVIVTLAMTLAFPIQAEEAGEARQHYERAVRLEAEGDLPGALGAYQRANELRPSYRLHRHMGRVSQALGHFTDALAHYERFLTDGGARVQVTRRREVESALAEVRGHVGAVRIEAPSGAAISIDSVPIGRAPLDRAVPVNEGQRTLEVRLDGHHDFTESIAIEGGAERAVTVTLNAIEAPDTAPSEPVHTPVQEPLPEPEPEPLEADSGGVHRAWFWTGLALSLATLTVGAVVGGLALGEQSSFDELNVPGRTHDDDLELDDLQSRGEAMSVTADVLLFTGAALAVATLILAFFTDFDPDEPGARASFTPSGSGGFFTLQFDGGF